MEQTLQPILPVFLLFVGVIGLALGLLIVGNVFNPGRPDRVTRMPYESGMDPIHDTRRRFDVRFYLLAIAFLVFDVELLFLYPWAVAWRPAVVASGPRDEGQSASDRIDTAVLTSHRLLPATTDRGEVSAAFANRHIVFWSVMTFVGLLVLGFVYDWRKGVFQWR